MSASENTHETGRTGREPLPDRGCVAAPTQCFVPFPRKAVEQSIPERFEQQVSRYPTRLALKSRQHAWTYAELNDRVNQTAHTVLEAGGAQAPDGPGPVALLFEHDAPLIAAILGVLKAGRIYVPLDLSCPRARTEYILADTEAPLLLTNTANLPFARELAPAGCRVLDLDAIGSRCSTADPGLSLSPDTLSNILYTSGSTGRPKGVVQNHRNLLDEARLHTNFFHTSMEDRLPLASSCSFSASIRRIFPALLNGAALCLLDIWKEGVRALPAWLSEEAVTITNAKQLLRDCVDLLTGPDQFPALRWVTFGGEPVYRRDVEQYRRYFSDRCRLAINLASTEAGALTRHLLDKQSELAGAAVPVGFPMDGKEILLLDESGDPVGSGEIGEIAVRGRTLFLGYWRQPERTREVLLPDPAGGAERVFRTGDLGRRLPDGALVHMGRKDFQVKICGYRIETGEVETALLEVEGIREAVVTARDDRKGNRRLVAYLVPARSPVPTISALRRALAAALPEYMIPSIFVFLEQFPRTATGKVDRPALPAPGRARPELETPYAAPREPVEEMVAEAWAEVLDLDAVGIHDSFFELGGDSLLAGRLLARLREAFQVEIPYQSFYATATAAALTQWLIAREPAPGRTAMLAQISQQISEMSPEEVRGLLTAKRRTEPIRD